MRSRTLVATGVALMAVAGCSTSIVGQANPLGATSQGGTAQIASVADLGAVVQHNAEVKDSVHFESSIDVPDQGALTATGDMKFGNGHASGQMMMNLPDLGEFTIVIVDTAIYMKLPPNLLSQLNQIGQAPTKQWVEVPMNGTTGSSALGSTANLANMMDPTHMIDEVKSAGTITQTTQEQVNGVQTTHYAINVSVAKLAQTMTDNPTEQQALSTVKVPTVPFDLWVDSANLPVRLVSTIFEDSSVTTGKAEQVTTTTNYSQWGEQITINTPPADQVTEIGGN